MAESSCLVRIAGAICAEYYVDGSVGVAGEQVFIVKLMNVIRMEIVNRLCEIVKKDNLRVFPTLGKQFEI